MMLTLLLTAIMAASYVSSSAAAKVKPVANSHIILTRIRTSKGIEIKNATSQPVTLNKEGFKYSPLDNKTSLIIKNDVKITAKSISYSNAIVEGNLYVLANKAVLNNIQVKGTVFIDPGRDGVVKLSKVTAKEIKVLSGGENSIYLNNVDSNNLTINSISKVRIETTGETKITNTAVKSYALFDTQEGTLGTITADGSTEYQMRTSNMEHSPVNDISETSEEAISVQLEEKSSNDQNQADDVTLESANQPDLNAYIEVITIDDYDDYLYVVNKNRSLPVNWKPNNLVQVKVPYKGRPEAKYLRKDASDALTKLFAKAKSEGINLYAVSGFRSYELQKIVYAKNVSQLGLSRANVVSASPGKSEHQSGLAMDISVPSLGYTLNQSFGNTREGIWLQKNAAEFGFVIRYPKGKEAVTGYIYEPWHIRFIGKDMASEIMKRNITIEEYFQI